MIQAKLSKKHEIEIWEDRSQTRRFIFIDDCLKGIRMILNSDIIEPSNQLVDIVEKITGVKLKGKYNLKAPKGGRGRNTDNTLIQKLLQRKPNTPLEVGMEQTYAWINDQMAKN